MGFFYKLKMLYSHFWVVPWAGKRLRRVGSRWINADGREDRAATGQERCLQLSYSWRVPELKEV